LAQKNIFSSIIVFHFQAFDSEESKEERGKNGPELRSPLYPHEFEQKFKAARITNRIEAFHSTVA